MVPVAAPIDLQKYLKIALFSALTLGIVLYLIFQARFLLEGPQITLTDTLKPVHNTRIVEVHGTVQNATSITLNGREIFTNEAGDFAEPLVLENGYTIMSLRAKDRYGRETELRRSLVYRPASNINF